MSQGRRSLRRKRFDLWQKLASSCRTSQWPEVTLEALVHAAATLPSDEEINL